MGKPGGGTNTNTVVQQSQPPAQFLNAYGNLSTAAQNQASAPLNQYSGSLVSGFTPQQSQAFDITQNLQGQYAPYLNAAARSFGQATQPLWPSLPQFNTSGLPQGATSAINTAQQYGAAAAQPIAQQLYPYTESAMGAAQNLTSNAAPYAALATQPVNTQPYTGFGLNTAQSLPGQVSPYTGSAQQAASSAPGSISQFESPYTQQVTSALQGLFNQQNAQQLAQVRGSSVGQGAYGGDREGVAEALTAQQQQLAEAPAMSQALQQGYQSSVQAAQQQAALEAQTGLGAGQLTSQTGLGAGQLGLGAGQLGLQGQLGQGQLGLGAGQLINQAGAQQGQLALGAGGLLSQGLTSQGQLGLGAGQLNLAAGQGLFNEFNTQQQQQLAAEQANAWLNSQAGFGMSALGSEAQSLGLGGAQALLGTGGMQQQLGQEQLNIPYEQFLQQQAYPYQQLGFEAPILEGTGSAAGGTSSTSYPGASVASQLGGLGLAGVGAAGLYNQIAPGGIAGLFGGGAGLNSAIAGTGGLTAADVLAAAPTADALGAVGTGLVSAIPFAARGGRVGYQSGGLATPGSGAVTPPDPALPNGHLPQVPKIGLDSIVPPGPAVKTGAGPPKPPQGQTVPGSQDLTPQQEIQGLGQAVKLFKSPGEARGGLVGIPHPHLGGGLSDEMHLANPTMTMGHAGLGHFQSGGEVSPLTATAPLSNTAPNVQGFYQQLTQMPLEQLREMSVRIPPTTSQGQLIQRALAAKEMTPATGMAAASPGGTSPQGQQPSMGLNALPLGSGGAGGIGGFADGGAIPEDPDADPHPVVDHSGKTVVIHYPSEGKSLDLGIPSMSRGRASGGTTVPLNMANTSANLMSQYNALDPATQAAYNGVVGTNQSVYNTPASSGDFTNKLDLTNVLSGYNRLSPNEQAAYNAAVGTDNSQFNNTTTAGLQAKLGLESQLGGWTWSDPNAPAATAPAAPAPAAAAAPSAPVPATPAPSSGGTTAFTPSQQAQQQAVTPAQQQVFQNARVGAPSPNLGFNIPRPQATNPFQGIQTPSLIDVGQANIPQPMNYLPLQTPQVNQSTFQPSGANYNNTAPGLAQLPIAGNPITTWSPNVWARGGRVRLQDGGLADAAQEISNETKQILQDQGASAPLPPKPEAGTVATQIPPRGHGVAGASQEAPGTGGLAAAAPSAPDLETTRATPGARTTPSTIVATETLGAAPGSAPSPEGTKPEFTEIPDYLHPLFHDIFQRESGGKDILYGPGNKPVPAGNVIPGAIGPTGRQTHAFGEPQFEPGTWNAANDAAKAWGQGPLNKDDRGDREWAALYTARRDYRAHTGRELDADAQAGNIDRSALTGTWPSLGSGGSGGGVGGKGIAAAGGSQDTGDPVIKAGVLPPQGGLGGTGTGGGLAAQPPLYGPRTHYEPGPGASPWMALIAAGLGTMAGRSPQGLVNLGQGGLEGVKVLGQQEQEKMRSAQLANEAENRQATLGIEQQRLQQTGQYQQGELGIRTQDLQIRQQQVDRALQVANQHFEVEMSRAKTAEERAHIMDQHYMDIAQHQQISDSINAGYRAALISKPVAGRDPNTGELGNFVFSPEQGKYVFTPGATVAKAPTPTSFDRRQEAWLAVHKDDLQGALDFAGGRKTMSAEERSIAIAKMAQKSMSDDLTAAVLKPEEREARTTQWKKYWEGQISSGAPAPTPGAAPTTTTPSAAAPPPKPSETDIAYVKAHPETKAQFEAHFGVSAPQ